MHATLQIVNFANLLSFKFSWCLSWDFSSTQVYLVLNSHLFVNMPWVYCSQVLFWYICTWSGTALATGGEDGVLKIWSRNGMLRSTLAQIGKYITCTSMGWMWRWLNYKSKNIKLANPSTTILKSYEEFLLANGNKIFGKFVRKHSWYRKHLEKVWETDKNCATWYRAFSVYYSLGPQLRANCFLKWQEPVDQVNSSKWNPYHFLLLCAYDLRSLSFLNIVKSSSFPLNTNVLLGEKRQTSLYLFVILVKV